MDRAPLGIDAELETSLRRMADALARSRDSYAGRVEEALAAIEIARDQRAATPREPSSQTAQQKRREERQQRIQEQRERRRGED